VVLDQRGVFLAWVVVLAALTGGVGAAQAQLPADLEVVDTSCDDGQVYAAVVDVTLRTDEPVRATAHAWSARSHVQLAWAPTRVELSPGEQTIEFRAPRERAAIGGDRAQLALYAGQQRAIVNWRPESCR
jgi:hypothetical protein